MIKAEVVFDGEKIIVNGKEFSVFAEYGYDTVVCFGDNTDGEYLTIEEAVIRCMEHSK